MRDERSHFGRPSRPSEKRSEESFEIVPDRLRGRINKGTVKRDCIFENMVTLPLRGVVEPRRLRMNVSVRAFEKNLVDDLRSAASPHCRDSLFCFIEN